MYRFFARLAVLFFTLCGLAVAAVNVNSAGVSELETLPGIGPSKAGAILDYRAKNGPFESLAQLDAVPGIGPATLENIRPHVIFSDSGEPDAEPTEPPPSPVDGGAKVPSSAAQVNINTATPAELESLPGIGPSKAAAIVSNRDAQGVFSSCDALQRVKGIGAATVSGLSHACTVTE